MTLTTIMVMSIVIFSISHTVLVYQKTQSIRNAYYRIRLLDEQLHA